MVRGEVVLQAEDGSEAVASLCVSRGWGLIEMRPITLSLEEIFIRIIQGEAS